MLINIERTEKVQAVTIDKLIETLERFRKVYPKSVAVLNERDGCIDLYHVEPTYHGDRGVFCAKILWE
jgi:hypothetical protein